GGDRAAGRRTRGRGPAGRNRARPDRAGGGRAALGRARTARHGDGAQPVWRRPGRAPHRRRRDPSPDGPAPRDNGLGGRRVRVLQQCIYFPPEVGGLESHAYYLCRELVRLGDEVTMVTSRSMPDAPRREVMDGVQVVRTWFPGKSPAGWTAHTLASIPTYLPLARQADV